MGGSYQEAWMQTSISCFLSKSKRVCSFKVMGGVATPFQNLINLLKNLAFFRYLITIF